MTIPTNQTPASDIEVGQVISLPDGQLGRVTGTTPGSNPASLLVHYTTIDTANPVTTFEEHLKTDLLTVV